MAWTTHRPFNPLPSDKMVSHRVVPRRRAAERMIKYLTPHADDEYMKRSQSDTRYRGVTLIYVAVIMVVMVGFTALAVDYARIQLDKTQAQAAADGAALYAASGIIGGTPTTVIARAVTAAADNSVDGSKVVVDPTQDVLLGTWDPASKTFSALSGSARSGATAVQVTVHRALSRGTQIPLAFAGVLGFTGKDLQSTAIASIGTVNSQTVPATASPWLAGMPNGSIVPAADGNPTPADAPNNSPIDFPVTGGTTIRFTSTNGDTSWDNAGDGVTSASPDGDPTFIAGQAPCNGINTTYAPLNAMMGIFLDNNAPNTTAMAGTLDFSTAASRDFTTLSPQLKQVFFIGDGLTSGGQLQSFVAPPGATRLFVGTSDMYGWWWDNVGTIQFIAVQGNQPVLVK
jgi:Flp pilus assembly protein TadG